MNLANNISTDDIERVNDSMNHSDFESGFESQSDDNFGFDDLNDLFGDESDNESFGGDPFGSGSGSSFGNDSFGSNGNSFGNNGFGNNGFGSNGFGNSGFGSNGFGNNSFGSNGFGSNGFGSNSFGNNGFNSPFGQQQQNQQQGQQKDLFDKAVDTGEDTLKSIGVILMELFKSLRERNADDFGFLSRNAIMTGIIMLPIGIALGIIGWLANINFLSFNGMGLQISLCGALLVASGIMGIGVSALILSKMGDNIDNNINNIPDELPSEDNVINEFEDNIGDEFDSLFDDLLGDLDNDFDTSDMMDLNDAEPEEPEFEPDDEPEAINFSESLDNINENTYLTRETLFNTFKPLFPSNTPKFAETKEIDTDSDDFRTLQTICLKALSNLANCEIEDVDSHLESATESFFSYQLRVKRINKVKKGDELAREIEFYMREDSTEEGVNATVDIVGDFYKITVTKGVSPVVTFGDIFKLDYVCDFFLDKGNKLPMISGIDELGKVLIDDAKNFDTMLIAGKPRSGKSWYVLSILMALILFNTPEDVQFVIIDPKESNLFKTIALLPHVCGLHNDNHILSILDDIINVEAPRRKNILSQHRCDDIWAVRKKGIKLPVLYLVIDEYITVLNNLDKDKQKEFDGKIQTLISQLPSLGIRLLFVPHRATGVVNKTNRTMLQFTAAVRADLEDVKDTLGVAKWNRALTQPGDLAIKNTTLKNGCYARGAALTIDDGDNSIFIETAAKAFYKMGVDIPDMSNLRIACNRNEEYVRQELGDNSTRVQYDASNILADIEDTDINELLDVQDIE